MFLICTTVLYFVFVDSGCVFCLQLLQNQLTSGLNLLNSPPVSHVTAPLLSPTSPTHASSPMSSASTGTGIASPGLPGLSNLTTVGSMGVGSSGPLSPLGSLGSLNSSVNSTMGSYNLLSEPLPGYSSEFERYSEREIGWEVYVCERVVRGEGKERSRSGGPQSIPLEVHIHTYVRTCIVYVCLIQPFSSTVCIYVDTYIFYWLLMCSYIRMFVYT